MDHPAPQPTPVAPVAGGHPADDGRTERAPAVLLAGLLATLAYAVFAHGATDTPAETRVQLALALMVLLAGGAVLTGTPSLRVQAPPLARAGVALLLAFAVWSGLSLLWSVAPDRTWMEINRALEYALIAGLGLVAGTSVVRCLSRLAEGWLVLVLVVALYALGGKTFPGVHVGGLFDLDQAGGLARLRAPLQYWNALGLVLVMALPVAVRVALDRGRRPAVRVGAVVVASLLLLDLGMTYSRGGILALAGVVVILVTLGGAGRLKSVVVLLVAGLGAAVPLAFALTNGPLTGTSVPLGDRIPAGRALAVIIVMSWAVLAVAVRFALAREDRLRWSAGRTRTVWRLTVTGAALLVLLIATAAAGSPKGLPANVDDAVRSFTVPTQDKQLDPSRVATTTSGNRWVWWQEAAGAFSDRPAGGWGAGSFRVTHLQYRRNTISVTQPHSVPLQFLSETGLVGFLLAYGGIGALLWVAVGRVRSMVAGRERDMGVALLAAAVAWLAHGVYDWDWDIPGVTLAPLLFLGVLAGGLPRREQGEGPAGRGVPAGRRGVVFLDPDRESRLRPGAVAGVAALTLALVAYGASAVLPAWSQSKSDAAQEAVGGATVSDDELRQAAAQADLAAKLDPLSIEPLLVTATIAQRRGRTLEARQALLDAVHRQPESARAWSQLGALTFALGDRAGFLQASTRALQLDPHNPLLRAVAARAVAFQTPPGDSATATGTPLPEAAAVAPPVAPVAVAPVAPAVPVTPLPPATPAAQ